VSLEYAGLRETNAGTILVELVAVEKGFCLPWSMRQKRFMDTPALASG
jgi:hypothetical protein